MGKAALPRMIRLGLGLASSCKAIPHLSRPAWPHSPALGSEVGVADTRGLREGALLQTGEYSYNALV